MFTSIFRNKRNFSFPLRQNSFRLDTLNNVKIEGVLGCDVGGCACVQRSDGNCCLFQTNSDEIR